MGLPVDRPVFLRLIAGSMLRVPLHYEQLQIVNKTVHELNQIATDYEVMRSAIKIIHDCGVITNEKLKANLAAILKQVGTE